MTPFQEPCRTPCSHSRRARTKAMSSLEGMLTPSEEPLCLRELDEDSQISLEVKHETAQDFSRRLHRAKRSLFLKSVEQPSTSVDLFRHLIMHLSSDDTEDTFEGRDSPVLRLARGRSGSLSSTGKSWEKIGPFFEILSVFYLIIKSFRWDNSFSCRRTPSFYFTFIFSEYFVPNLDTSISCW
jgi:hypothetical protein